MLNYLLFTADNEYTDDTGVTCTLDDHLAYLSKWGGSSDNYDRFDDLKEAIDEADSEAFDVVVVDSMSYEVIYESS